MCQDPRAGGCQPVPASTLESDSHWASLIGSLSIPVERDGNGASQEGTHNAGGAACPPRALFPLDKL